jgi:hypothetical protein
MQLAQSASALGAGILGFGLGARWGALVSNYFLIIIIMGGVIHIAGMYVLHLKTPGEKTKGIARLLWISAWLCLLLIIGLVSYLILQKK